MRVLVACEFSATVRDAFRKRGHDAWSCDLLPCEGDPQWHIQDDVLMHLEDGWDMMIAHPPCTYLTNAGVRHLHDSVASRNGVRAKIHGQARRVEMVKAAQFFNALVVASIPQKAIENPIPHRYAREIIGPYSQLIQPWQFGHKEMKATCLWLRGLPPLTPTNIVGPPPKDKDERKSWQKCHYQSPGPDRWKRRSITYQGIADAMADQWGGINDQQQEQQR